MLDYRRVNDTVISKGNVHGNFRLLKHHHFSGGELLVVLGSSTLEVCFFCKQKRRHTCCWILNPIKDRCDSISFHPDLLCIYTPCHDFLFPIPRRTLNMEDSHLPGTSNMHHLRVVVSIGWWINSLEIGNGQKSPFPSIHFKMLGFRVPGFWEESFFLFHEMILLKKKKSCTN